MLVGQRHHRLCVLLGSTPLPALLMQPSSIDQGPPETKGRTELLRQAERLVHPCQGLLRIPQKPQRPGHGGDPPLRVNIAGERSQHLVLGLVVRDALLQRQPSTDKLPARQENNPCQAVCFYKQPSLVRLLRELQALLRQHLRGRHLAPGQVKVREPPQHSTAPPSVVKLVTQRPRLEVVLFHYW